MKEKYEELEMEVIVFEEEDVVTSSQKAIQSSWMPLPSISTTP